MTCILAALAELAVVGVLSAACYPLGYMLGDLYERRARAPLLAS